MRNFELTNAVNSELFDLRHRISLLEHRVKEAEERLTKVEDRVTQTEKRLDEDEKAINKIKDWAKTFKNWAQKLAAYVAFPFPAPSPDWASEEEDVLIVSSAPSLIERHNQVLSFIWSFVLSRINPYGIDEVSFNQFIWAYQQKYGLTDRQITIDYVDFVDLLSEKSKRKTTQDTTDTLGGKYE